MPINCDISVRLDAGFWLLLGLVLLISVPGLKNIGEIAAKRVARN